MIFLPVSVVNTDSYQPQVQVAVAVADLDAF